MAQSPGSEGSPGGDWHSNSDGSRFKYRAVGKRTSTGGEYANSRSSASGRLSQGSSASGASQSSSRVERYRKMPDGSVVKVERLEGAGSSTGASAGSSSSSGVYRELNVNSTAGGSSVGGSKPRTPIRIPLSHPDPRRPSPASSPSAAAASSSGSSSCGEWQVDENGRRFRVRSTTNNTATTGSGSASPDASPISPAAGSGVVVPPPAFLRKSKSPSRSSSSPSPAPKSSHVIRRVRADGTTYEVDKSQAVSSQPRPASPRRTSAPASNPTGSSSGPLIRARPLPEDQIFLEHNKSGGYGGGAQHYSSGHQGRDLLPRRLSEGAGINSGGQQFVSSRGWGSSPPTTSSGWGSSGARRMSWGGSSPSAARW